MSTLIVPYYLANMPPLATTPPLPPPNSFDENYCAGIITSEDSVTGKLCVVYKILYYAAVYVRGHFC